jgi:16S rRNA (cytidine1402-2'-O)-methyltransferase
MPNENAGILYVVATPIGNLQDMTLRAIQILKSVDRIAAEDTRHTAPLLSHFSIQKPSISLHAFNERERCQQLLDHLQQGESIALVSDAGTPVISDPGFHLVQAAKNSGVTVVPVPGACAAIAALSACGLPVARFMFEGFLPAKAQARHHRLTDLAHETRALVFYEAPHRVAAVLQTMAEVFGPGRKSSVARELTKIHETIMTDTLANLAAYFQSHKQALRGEFVIIIAGSDAVQRERKEVTPEAVLDVLLAELPVKQAAALASTITGESKNILYQLALTKKPAQKDRP